MPASAQLLYQGERDVASLVPAVAPRLYGVRESYIDISDIWFI